MSERDYQQQTFQMSAFGPGTPGPDFTLHSKPDQTLTLSLRFLLSSLRTGHLFVEIK
jgi:hypothetical protein